MEYEGKIIAVEGNKIAFELNANFDTEQALGCRWTATLELL